MGKRSRTRICYAGTYERGYPRNRLVIQALQDTGAAVEEAHVAVFERQADKSGLAILTMLGLAIQLGLAYLRLVPEVALRLLRCDALAVGYIGQLDMLALAPVARVMGRPVIFNPLVTLTDTLIEDRRRFGEGSIPGRLVSLLDRLALRLADVVLVDTPENGEYLEERFGVSPERIAVLPVGADEEIFYPASKQHDNDHLDMLFYGKFIPLHGLETIIRAAKLLQDRDAAVRLELVGLGQEYERMRELARTLGVRTIIWTDWIPFQRLGERIRRADVVLGVFDDGPKAGRVIPNKVHQSLACGVATITRSSPALENLLTDGQSALLVPPADPAALARSIIRLQDDELRERIASNGRRAWEASAGRTALAKRAGDVVRELGIAE